MEYRWIENIEEFQLIADEWDKALIATQDNNPFLLSDFIITWWRYHSNRQLRILVVYDGGEIAGGIPLFINNEKLSNGFARVLRYTGLEFANYTEPLYGASDFKFMPVLLNALRQRKDWDVLHLTDIRSGNKLMMECPDYPVSREILLYTLQDHLNWAVDLSSGVNNYITNLSKAGISKRMSRYLKSRRKYINKNYGELELRQITGEAEIRRYFDLYIKFSINSFYSRYRRSMFEKPVSSTFMREFLVIMDRKKRLDAHLLCAEDKVLAISFGYRFGQGFNWAFTAFDYNYKYVKPGYLLIEEIIKEIIKRGQTYYNWYGHGAFYKSEWCNVQLPLFQLFLVRPGLRGMYYQKIKKIKSKLKSHKNLMGLAFKIRTIPQRLRLSLQRCLI
ncbi:MAG: GNAT family N-acetyltransferase [Candidatus Omnitrophica bacterium]|nr:GNAT family N-acetyltransferase [Candidatus Omnitrophota bacterium]